MYKRVNMQPDPMKDYILECEDGSAYIGRWLVGNDYEGWYLKNVKDIQENSDMPKIVSQKDLKVVKFYDRKNPTVGHQYIPKKLLDEAFWGRSEILNFYTTPDIMCYL